MDNDKPLLEELLAGRTTMFVPRRLTRSYISTCLTDHVESAPGAGAIVLGVDEQDGEKKLFDIETADRNSMCKDFQSNLRARGYKSVVHEYTVPVTGEDPWHGTAIVYERGSMATGGRMVLALCGLCFLSVLAASGAVKVSNDTAVLVDTEARRVSAERDAYAGSTRTLAATSVGLSRQVTELTVQHQGDAAELSTARKKLSVEVAKGKAKDGEIKVLSDKATKLAEDLASALREGKVWRTKAMHFERISVGEVERSLAGTLAEHLERGVIQPTPKARERHAANAAAAIKSKHDAIAAWVHDDVQPCLVFSRAGPEAYSGFADREVVEVEGKPVARLAATLPLGSNCGDS